MHQCQFKGNPSLYTQSSTQLTTHLNHSLLFHIYTQEPMLIHCLWFTFYAFMHLCIFYKRDNFDQKWAKKSILDKKIFAIFFKTKNLVSMAKISKIL